MGSMKKRILLFLFIILQISLFHHAFTLAKAPENYLKGKFYSSVKNYFLIATNKMKDNRFEKTVIVMLENDEGGAWGLVVNKPIGSIPLALLVDPSLSTTKEREELFNKLVQKMYDAGRALEAATQLEIDAVIDPADTRSIILKALETG